MEDRAPKRPCFGQDARPDHKPKIKKYEWIETMEMAKVFHPTFEEFQNAPKYLASIFNEAKQYGIVKIVSPKEWRERTGFVDRAGTYTTRLQKISRLRSEAGRVGWQLEHDMEFGQGTLQNFQTLKEHTLDRTCSDTCSEKEFWRRLAACRDLTVQYASDVVGSFCDDSFGTWNLETLPMHPDWGFASMGFHAPGVTSPMCYVGVLGSMFAWHHEDNDLYSMSYMHQGTSKTWYGIPGKFRDQTAAAAVALFGAVDDDPEFLSRKTTMVSPSAFLKRGIPVYKIVQKPGEFVLTCASAFHSGFSHGFTCAEAVNLAPPEWLEYGMHAVRRSRRIGKEGVLDVERIIICAGPSFAGGQAYRKLVDWHAQTLKALASRGICILPMNTVHLRFRETCVVCRHVLFLIQCACACSPLQYYCPEHTSHMRCCDERLPGRRVAYTRFSFGELQGLYRSDQPRGIPRATQALTVPPSPLFKA